MEVDPETGQVRLRKLVTAHDVGTVINPLTHQGQIEGGVVQGIGQALTEQLLVQDGAVTTLHLGDYKLPTAMDIPELTTVLVETQGGPAPVCGEGGRGTQQCGRACCNCQRGLRCCWRATHGAASDSGKGLRRTTGKGDGEMRTIQLRINGQSVIREIPDNRLLIDLLRYDMGLTGTKEGCSVGVCGACTVLIDGQPVSSCLTLAVMANGAEVLTIEGLAEGERLHPLQRAFIESGGFQCGICTPGQIMAAKALLDVNPQPAKEEIQTWMMGNLCRCTGYYKIIEAIQAAAAEKVGP